MKCPYCKKEIQLDEHAIANVEIYGNSVISVLNCCNNVVQIYSQSSVLIKTLSKTEIAKLGDTDDFGIEIDKSKFIEPPTSDQLCLDRRKKIKENFLHLIEVKGKTIDSGKWIRGYLNIDEASTCSIVYYEPVSNSSELIRHEEKIFPSTVCRRINSDEIFEGDVVHFGVSKLGEIVDYDYKWSVKILVDGKDNFPNLELIDLIRLWGSTYQVVGNIHEDNVEQLMYQFNEKL